ncbi:hypothetical protein D3C81_1480100 [compost metagenome]
MKYRREFQIINPTPLLAATISAPIIAIKEEPMARRMPVNIYGTVAGTITWSKICHSDAPILRAERTLSSSTAKAPLMVFRRTMNRVEYKISIIFDFSPMPNQSMNKVMKASGGINRIKLRNGSVTARNDLKRPMIIPSGMAIALPSTHPVSTRRKLMPIYRNKDPSWDSSRAPCRVRYGPGRKSGLDTEAAASQIRSPMIQVNIPV